MARETSVGHDVPAVLARLQWLVNANLTSGRPGSRQKYVMVCASHLLGELIDNLYRGS